MGIEEVKDSDRVTDRCWHIARDSLELAYSWDRRGLGRHRYLESGIAWNRFKFEYTYVTHTHIHTHTHTHNSANTE